MLLLLYHSLMTKLSTPAFLKFFKHLKKHHFTYLFTALSSSTCTKLPITSSRRRCIVGIGTALNRVQLLTARLIESSSSRLRAGQRRTL